MKSPITKLAAAAVIIIAVMIGINSFLGSGTSVAFADVIQPILDARTVIMDILIGPEGRQAVIHDEVMGSRIRRTVSNVQGTDIIIDLEQMELLALTHAEKTAEYVKLEGLGKMPNYLELLQDVVTRMQDEEEFQVQDQGLQEIDGHDYIVFVAESDKETITIWVDPETALPVRIKQKTPNMQIICNNLQFDVVLDESRFSMEVPDGYVVQQAGAIDYKKSSESDFIETLRIWAEIIEDGHFPDSINLEDIVKSGPKIDQAFKTAGNRNCNAMGTRPGIY
jgi:outer membrane lipoprotein-sorting protein